MIHLILFLLCFPVWLYIVFKISRFLTRKIIEQWWGVFIAFFIFFMLLALPLTDEFIGKRQFEKICNEESMVHIDVASTRGRTVYFDSRPQQYLADTAVAIKILPIRYIDAKTGELVFHYAYVTANGGFVSRMFPATEDVYPWTFSGQCGPDNQVNLFDKLGLKKIEKEHKK
ncbi:hypothetical protein [Undibacterium sp. TJN19]|uniref:hypothetical protein n=1 Tax=Undibacterium sp. TJN19 TaxID=3413055 RepID=UPI003BF01C1A